MTNGEKFKTAEERHKAYALYCESMREMNLAILHDTFEWLELEYSVALRACPFCGSKNISESQSSVIGTWCVICPDCGCRTEWQNKEDAITIWNRRSK